MAVLATALSLASFPVVQKAQAATSYTYAVCSSGCKYSNLQTAINALPSGGGSILIKDGHYTWYNTISLKSGTALTFSSGAYVTFTGSYKPVLQGYGVKNVSIYGGSITAKYSGVKAIAFWKTTGIHVNGMDAVLVQGSNSNGFYCSDCIDVYVSNMNIKSASRLIDIKTSTRDASSGLSYNIWVQNNVGSYSSIEGIKVNWCKDVHIIGNKITNTQENGIDIGFNINSEVKSNTLIKVGLKDAAGIHPDGTNTATISNNYIETTGSTAIPVYRTTKVNVLDNTIKYSGAEGISIIDSKDTTSYTTVKNNWVYAPSIQGIYESPDQYQVVIAYNTLENLNSGYKGVLVISPNPTTSVYSNTVK